LVLGPVDFWALRRLAASRAGLKAEIEGALEIPSSLAIRYSMTSLILLSMFFLGYGLAGANSLDWLGPQRHDGRWFIVRGWPPGEVRQFERKSRGPWKAGSRNPCWGTCQANYFEGQI